MKNSRDRLTSRMTLSELKDKVGDQMKEAKNMKKIKHKKRHIENMGHHENNKPLNCKNRQKRFLIKWHKPDLKQDHRRKLLKTRKVYTQTDRRTQDTIQARPQKKPTATQQS